MSFKIYHQCGHNTIWNIDTFKEGIGDGLILSARYFPRHRVEDLDHDIKQKSFFDPQFYVPSIARGKLETYDFFPEQISDGFDTQDFTDKYAQESAKRCIEFQLENDFEKIIIPARLIEGNQSDFIEQQTRMFVEPFLEEIKTIGTDKEILLQFICTQEMLKDDETFRNILGWLTYYEEISGIYIIPIIENSQKQIRDTEIILKLLDLIEILKRNQLQVIVGFCNTEAYLLSLAEPNILTMGSYENTRIFRTFPFQEDKNEYVPAPEPRIYSNLMLQWIRHEYIGAIKRNIPILEFLHDNNYLNDILDSDFNPHINNPSIYKHYFNAFYEQLSVLKPLTDLDLFNQVRTDIKGAIETFEFLIDEKGVVMTSDSDGSHLYPWLTVANTYGQKLGVL